MFIVYVDTSVKHLFAVSNPTYPRVGRGGNLQILDDKSGDNLELQIPY